MINIFMCLCCCSFIRALEHGGEAIQETCNTHQAVSWCTESFESPLEKVRRLGMVVAECVTSSLEPNGEKLVFEYAEDDEDKITEVNGQGLTGEIGYRKRKERSLTVMCPQQIACHLTEEFFAPNYNLQQRMDMLNVLADAAQQLSTPAETAKTRTVPRKFPLPQADSVKPLQAVPEWQKIVQERIDGKTKRISKGPSPPQPTAVANKFAGVAGFFFFPLMKNFDSKVNTLDLLRRRHSCPRQVCLHSWNYHVLRQGNACRKKHGNDIIGIYLGFEVSQRGICASSTDLCTGHGCCFWFRRRR
ncbi:TEL2, telomere maintenance protein 2 [Desmophyllum pertusum]|uniref:TEL2, telomere maintenance protein 2 n=1 Tax=Desmophyllum pertusum TaxID=174260 RepID=A0A9W9ZUL0_9CNID|nr:TEL2, telomere maintenance protein 2 [Desmophyllum pertusum]